MTITYSYSVANATMCGFAKLLLRWKGSIYKLMYREMLIFISLYTFLSVLYRWCFTPAQKKIFEKIALYCHTYTDLIPLSFVFGFYVALVVARWWQQYNAIPWPDTLMLKVTSYVTGEDERGQMIRRTLMRYANLILVLTLQGTSIQVKKRFPTLDHLVEAGLMTKEDLRMLDSVPNAHGKWWFPSIWFCTLAVRARKENRIRDDYFLDRLIRDLDDFRGKCGLLFAYDWISVPLVYTQVATLAFYTFFLATLMGRQYLDPDQNYPGRDMDLYIPLFTILQFFFYMGWLKVAEQLINPFGEDDDDFEMNWIIDRNLQASYMATDCMHNKLPKLQKDMYWEDIEFNIPYTKSASKMKGEPFKGSTMNMDIAPEDMGFVPMETILEADTNEDEYDISSPDASPKSRHRLLANLDVLKKVDVFKDLEKIKMVADMMGASARPPAPASRVAKISADNSSSQSQQRVSGGGGVNNSNHVRVPKGRASLSATASTNQRNKGGDGSKSSFLGSSIKSLRSGSSQMLLGLFGNSGPAPQKAPQMAVNRTRNSYNVFNAASNYHRSNPRRHRLSSSAQTASAMATRHNSFNYQQEVETHSQTPTPKLSVTSDQTQAPSLGDFGRNREEQHRKLRDAMLEMEEAVEKAKSEAIKEEAKHTKITTAPINIPKLANTATKAKVKPNNGVANGSGGTLGRKSKKNNEDCIELEQVNGVKGASQAKQDQKFGPNVVESARAGAGAATAKNAFFRGFIINNVKGDRAEHGPLQSLVGTGAGANGKEDSFSLADDDDDDDMPTMNYEDDDEENDDEEEDEMEEDENEMIVSESVASLGVDQSQGRRYARHPMSPRGRKDKANVKSFKPGHHNEEALEPGRGHDDFDSGPDEEASQSVMSFEPAPLMLVGSCPPSYTTSYNPDSRARQIGRRAKMTLDSGVPVTGGKAKKDGGGPVVISMAASSPDSSSHTDIDEFAQNQDTLTASSRYPPCLERTTEQAVMNTTPSSPYNTSSAVSPGLRRKYSCPAFANDHTLPNKIRPEFNKHASCYPGTPSSDASTLASQHYDKFKRRGNSFTTTHSQTPTPTFVNRRSRMVHALSHSFTPPPSLPLDRPQYDFQGNRYIPAAPSCSAGTQQERDARDVSVVIVDSREFDASVAGEEDMSEGLRRHSSPSKVAFDTGLKNYDAHWEENGAVDEVAVGEGEEDFEEKEQPELYVIHDSFKMLPADTGSLDAKATQTDGLSSHLDLDARPSLTTSSTPLNPCPFELGGWQGGENVTTRSTELEPLIQPPSPAFTYTAANSHQQGDASVVVSFKPPPSSKTHKGFRKISDFFRPTHSVKRWPPTRKKMNSLSVICGRESSEERQAFLAKDFSFLSGRHSYGHASRRGSTLPKSMSEPGTFTTSIPSSVYHHNNMPLAAPLVPQAKLEVGEPALIPDPNIASLPHLGVNTTPFDKSVSKQHAVLEVIEEHCEIKCPSPQRVTSSHDGDTQTTLAQTFPPPFLEPIAEKVVEPQVLPCLSPRENSLSKDSLDSSRASVDTIDSRSALIPAPPPPSSLHATTKVSIPYTS